MSFWKKYEKNAYPKFGYDKQYYPTKILMVKFNQLDINTKKDNKAFKIYEKDYFFGLSIYQSLFKIDYIEKITKVKHEQLKIKINQSDWNQNIKDERLLMLEANVNQLKFYDSYNTIEDRNNNMFHLLNLIYSLQIIFGKNIQTKIDSKQWDFGNKKEIFNKTDWEIIKQLDEINSISKSKVDNIWTKIKTLRDIWTHYYCYIMNPCKKHKDEETCSCETKRILLKIIFWNDDIYFLIIEYKGEKNKYIIIRYKFSNIELILKNYLQDVLI